MDQPKVVSLTSQGKHLVALRDDGSIWACVLPHDPTLYATNWQQVPLPPVHDPETI
jgi:hypothetical protein